LRERVSPMKNRKREICTSGSVRDEDGQPPHPLGRRNFLHLAAGAAALPTVSRFACAQAYPSRPVRLIVPFAPAGGQVQVYFATTVASIEYIRAGRLRALAVTTATRSDALPDIPTVAEFVPGYEASSWMVRRRRTEGHAGRDS